MAMTRTVLIGEATQVGEARRSAVEVARRLAFGETDAGRVALVVTEAATNLVKHAGGGEIIVRGRAAEHGGGLEILALDTGPGIRDVGACLRDGYSTAGTAGTGLGALRRLGSAFDIYSLPGFGTAVFVRVGGTPRVECPLDWGAVCLPKTGEDRSGDAFAVHERVHGLAILVSDGLGHGDFAADASDLAVAAFASARSHPPATALQMIHQAMRATRGGAVAVTEVDVSNSIVRFAGVGNICGSVVSPSTVRRMVSHNGIVGRELRRIAEFSYPWSDDALLVLHSDGLATHWDLAKYPGLAARHPCLVAGVLYRDFTRGRDDVTVVVARARSGTAR
jgi:anti-sigma regulatory factor (Ser/Thr protein kinase)